MVVGIKTLQDNRAMKAFVLLVLTAIAFIAFVAIGATVGWKGLVGATASHFYEAVCQCMSLTASAGTEVADSWKNFGYYLQVPKAIFFLIGLGVFGTGIVKAIIKASGLLFNDQRFIKNISEVSLDRYPRHCAILSVLGLSKSFVLFQGDSFKQSFTHGLWKPRIYMSTGTYSYLTDEEFLSAILHEDYHRRHKDPLRLFVVTVLGKLLFFLPISNHLAKVFLDAKEKAADDNAVYFLGKPLELASAIVKLVRPMPGLSHAYLANSMTGMDSVEERVRRLVEPGSEDTDKKPSKKTLFFTIAFCTFFFGAVFVNGVTPYTQKDKATNCVSDSCAIKCCCSHEEIN